MAVRPEGRPSPSLVSAASASPETAATAVPRDLKSEPVRPGPTKGDGEDTLFKR